ncbi:glutathione synthetase-like [Dreissena polymorpha]|uniref:Glutathione synthetase n=1 Tax=Dreissena polymorpha TaxID=45954 RepID=A0A9D4G854_DREPO|nr:glutathione synthetase-like [Dreissena polymorpha]XP_052215468.1 glutathione synthetase-like [Dreissena polymorpha]XP_052215469.1 glutathione synthetase-like [Dreissena polymorpha]KAH3812243.1 hypothetical protein DPMN_140667 [Dreissena polymorpha]
MSHPSEWIPEEGIPELVQRSSGMALLYGVQKKITTSGGPESCEPMPFTLFPSFLPKAVLTKARSLHTHFQRLMFDVANDHEFLHMCLKDVLPVDEFTREFWNIYETVRNEGVTQAITIFISRNDFMMEASRDWKKGSQDIRQVEFNTFSSGAGGVGGAVTDVHRYSLKLSGFPLDLDKLPENRPTKGFAKGLVLAWEQYGNPSAVILFVVGVPEPNTPDQRWLERHIFEYNPAVRVIFRTFQQLTAGDTTLGDRKQLLVDGVEVAVVYYRYGYAPTHYPTKKEYDLRLTIERSLAIKCPSMAAHLAGCKKVQQVLAAPGQLEHFIADPDIARSIRETFVGLYHLSYNGSTNETVHRALANPDLFVLKPQREGGGNNLFGAELKTYLEKIQNTSEVTSWILMDRIKTVAHPNRLVRRDMGPELRDVCSELGIFGVHLSCGVKELENYECGFLLRTKPLEANEGGLFSGLSCLDSPLFVSD